MGLSKATVVWMGEQRVAVGCLPSDDLLLTQEHSESMAAGQADVGSHSPCSTAWPRQIPEPRVPSGCLKAGPWAWIPVPCWGRGACCSLGCMAGVCTCLAFSRQVQAGSNPAPSSGEGAAAQLSSAQLQAASRAPPSSACMHSREGRGPRDQVFTSRLKCSIQPGSPRCWVSPVRPVEGCRGSG